MNSSIIFTEPRIQLDLSLEEFLFILASERRGGDGISTTRDAVETGLYAVEEELGEAFKPAFDEIKASLAYSTSAAARACRAIKALS
jgi:hypothetical protein